MKESLKSDHICKSCRKIEVALFLSGTRTVLTVGVRCLAVGEVVDQGNSSSSSSSSSNSSELKYGVNICRDYTDTVSSNLTLVSPGFPHHYPSLTECRCLVTAQQRSKVCHDIIYASSYQSTDKSIIYNIIARYAG